MAPSLCKKGELTAILKGMKDVSPEERPKVGQLEMKQEARSRLFWKSLSRNWKKLFVKRK